MGSRKLVEERAVFHRCKMKRVRSCVQRSYVGDTLRQVKEENRLIAVEQLPTRSFFLNFMAGHERFVSNASAIAWQ